MLGNQAPAAAAAAGGTTAAASSSAAAADGSGGGSGAPSPATSSKLLPWLLRRVRPKARQDGTKEYAAEVLAILLQCGGPEGGAALAAANGVDLLLQVRGERERERQ